MPPVISTIVMLRLFSWRQRASMSAYFTNSLTPPTGLGLLASLAAGFSRSGSARLGRSQKDGLPKGDALRFKAINSRTGRGSPVAAPFNRERQWTPRHATLPFSPPSRSFAQALPGLWITRFLARPFLRSAQLGFSVQPRGTAAESRYAKGKSPAFRLEAGLKVQRPSLSNI